MKIVKTTAFENMTINRILIAQNRLIVLFKSLYWRIKIVMTKRGGKRLTPPSVYPICSVQNRF